MTPTAYWTDDFPELRGPWLGQTPPDLTPVEFVPEIFATSRMSFGTVFSPDGTEFFFGFERPGSDGVHDILVTCRVDDVWGRPEILSFNSDEMDGDHCLSADGNRLIWRSWRSLPGETEPQERSYLWWAERNDEGWGDAQLLRCGEGLQRSGYPAIGRSSTLYLTARTEGADVSICRSRWDGDAYGPLEEIVTGMKTGGDMCVSPDERFLIITCNERPENLGKGDLYVSFRRDDDTWTPLRHLGDVVNARGEDAYTHCPMITPGGEFLLFRTYDFATKQGRVFWVNARIIEGPGAA